MNKRATGSRSLLTVRASVVFLAPGFASSMSTLRENQTFSSVDNHYFRKFSLTDALIDLKANAKQSYHNARASITGYSKSDGGGAVMTIIALNTTVYLMWKILPTSFMIR